MRKYPPVPSLQRSATKTYKIDGTKMVIEKDTKVFIPVLGIHHDPKLYPDPDVFDPDRFSPEETANRHPYAFLPFGEGPRNCIGLRFGMMQAKLGMASLLREFKFMLSDNHQMKEPLSFRPSNFILTTKQGLWVNVEKCSG